MIRMTAVALAFIGGLATQAAGQAPAASPSGAASGQMSASAAAQLAEGWGQLARGEVAAAEATAAGLVRDDPRNPAVVALAVEAAIARGGWSTGLDAYDLWVSGRSVEDFYALRRVARAVLFDALQTRNLTLRLDVVKALVLDGEPGVVAALPPLDVDPPSRAAAGDPAAVAALGRGLANDPRILLSIEALGQSRSQAAVAPLRGVLTSPRAEVRAAAARALGHLDARDATPQLRALLKDPHLLPRIAAAESLMRMDDASASGLFADWFSSDIPDVRLKAAEASAINPDAAWLERARRLAQDPDPMVRIGAARLLGKHDPGTAMWALNQLTNDENLAIREEAQRVLPQAIGGDFAELRRYLRAADDETRVRAALRIVELTR